MSSDALTVQRGETGLFAVLQDDYTKQLAYLGQVVEMGDLTQSFGTPEPFQIDDPAVPGKKAIIGYSYPIDELPSGSFVEYMHPRSAVYLEQAAHKRCGQLLIARIGACSRQDSLALWDSVLVMEQWRVTELTWGALKGTDAGDVRVSGNVTAQQAYRIFSANFGERAATAVIAEVIDIIYADALSCGGCTKVSDGAQKIYAITDPQGGSPGLSGALVYSLNGGSDWTSVDIASLGGKTPSALAAQNIHLIVVSEDTGSHHYVEKDNISAVNFVEVSTGYVSSHSPRCLYVADGNHIAIGAAGGYVYKTEDLTTSVEVVEDGSATAQNVNAIHGVGKGIIVAVCDNNVILWSQDGETYSLLQTNAGLNGPEAGANLTTVAVVDQYTWYVGTNTGKLWVTPDQGKTWLNRKLKDQNNVSVINDIKITPERKAHMVLSAEVGGVGKIYRSIDGGRSWYNDAPAVKGLPSATRYNKVALADVYAIAAGGAKASDGIIVVSEGLN